MMAEKVFVGEKKKEKKPVEEKPEKEEIEEKERIQYSEKYIDHFYEYRHVVLPKELGKMMIEKGRLLTEFEWRSMGIQQSRGWEHYALHRPEPHVLLFRRPLGTNPETGKVDARDAAEARENYYQEMQKYQKY